MTDDFDIRENLDKLEETIEEREEYIREHPGRFDGCKEKDNAVKIMKDHIARRVEELKDND
jgi:hypothetical protein